MATRYDTHHLPSVSSTQDEARRLFTGTPLLVTTDVQIEGRGRSGRTWQRADRAVFASLALQPEWPPETWPRLALVAGLAARDALDGIVDLKWPNDLLLAGGKVGGLLSESAEGVAVIGLGINLWWKDPPAGISAVHTRDPGKQAAAGVAGNWARHLLLRCQAGPNDWGRDEYRSVCTTVGLSIEWEPNGRGRAVDVAQDGGLIVETEQGVVALASGEVRHIRTASLDDRPPPSEVEQ